MTEAEKAAMKQTLVRQRAGWVYLAEQRKEAIRKTITKDAVASLDSAFAYPHAASEA